MSPTKQITFLHHALLLLFVCGRRSVAVTAFLPTPRYHDSAIINHLSKTSSSALHASLIPGNESPRVLVQQGMAAFRDYNVPASLSYFNKADADGSMRPYLWQRGISYYYLDQFQEGSEQFRVDVSANPLDVEEIVWDIACLARMDERSGFPPEKRMALPEGKKDRRRIMSTVYSLFRGDGATEYDLRKAGHDGNISDEFYSLFYLGL